MNETVEEIYSEDKARRIVIFKRSSGSFGWRAEYLYRNDYFPENVIERWASLGENASYYDSLEIVKAEVTAKSDWLTRPRSVVT